MSEAVDVVRDHTGLEIAVIGMAGRFPGAEDVAQFWTNLVDGVYGVTRFSEEELLGSGVGRETLADEKYVRAKGVFPNLEFFDSTFFNYTPADATVLDPQVRALHEEVYHALEDAGYSAEGRSEAIGLFLGATNNLAWESHTLRRYIAPSGTTFAGTQLNDKDFAATRIAYALDLKGPALTLHTACSTSLVAIDLACRSLWTGGCQIALAGGSGLTLPHKRGYLYQENMIHSPDGYCRAFDKQAGGTVEGNGAGVVVLKRLETALRDGDHVYAVVKGSAVNNDGSRKVGYTAPSIDGQAEVIRKAHRVANIASGDVSYVETHGTGTALGDPIEVEALRKTFGAGTPRTVGLGSLKASIGHLDTAAGVASFIKTCKVLEQRTVPKSLHFTELNPNISLDDSPFYVVTENEELRRKRSAEQRPLPLRAVVSSFGIGGSNAHLVLEEAPGTRTAAAAGRRHNTFVVSATSAAAIQRIKQNFVDHLTARPDTDGADLAWTLQNRQRRLGYRYAVEFADAAQLRERLQESLDAEEEPARLDKNARREVFFLFSGLGAQHLGMARRLYETEPVFKDHLEQCFAIDEALGNEVPREVFFSDSSAAQTLLDNIETTQVLLFMLEYCMARTLIGWGVLPKGMAGHSTGELAAACVSGVFSLEDGIRLVHARGSLMDTTPDGTLTSVKASEDVVRAMLGEESELAAVNSPEDCTVSGTSAAIAEMERQCAERGIRYTHVDADHAYHSQYMECILDKFHAVAEQVNLRPPQIPYVSNVTGTWITADQATAPDYYCAHVRETVQFKRGVETMLERGNALFVEVGPGKSLSSFVRAIGQDRGVVAINALRHRMEDIGDDEHLARTVKKLWEAGVALSWKAFHAGRQPRKLPLPLYPFDKTEFPVDVEEFQRFVSDIGAGGGEAPFPAWAGASGPTTLVPATATDRPQPALQMVWSRSMFPASNGKDLPRVLVVLTDDGPRAKRIVGQVAHWRTLVVTFGDEYRFRGQSGAVIRPRHPEDLQRLVDDLEDHALAGDAFVVHREDPECLTDLVGQLCALVGRMRNPCVRDLVVLDHQDLLWTRGDFLPRILGLNLEHPGLRVRAIHCAGPPGRRAAQETWGECLRRELEAERPDEIAVRYDGGRRSVPLLVPLHGLHEPAVRATGRTVVVCRSGDVDDVLAGVAGDPARRLQVVPFDLQPVSSAPTPDGSGGRCTVLPAVTGSTWGPVASGLAARVRGLSGTSGVVVWDRPSRDGADRVGPDVRRAILGALREVCRERGLTCGVLSRPELDRTGWDGDVTAWFADNGAIDAEVRGPRLYSFGQVTGSGHSALDLVARMDRSGLGTAYSGLDLLEAQASAKAVQDEGMAEAAPGDEREALAGRIEGELIKLLGFSEINARADVFDLGLDSVKLVQLTSALEQQGYKVLASDVYNHPTVDGLTAFLGRSAKRISQHGESSDSVATLLGERLGVTCSIHSFRPAPDEDELVLLFLDDPDDLCTRVVREINDLRLASEFVPHYVLPRTLEEGFLAHRDFGSLGIGVDSGRRAAGVGGLESVFAEIDRSQDELRRLIGSQPVKWTYPISGIQKHHFRTEARLQLYLIQFRELVDVDVLQRALGDVVGRHGLLRSFLTKAFGRFRWKEFEPPTSFALPRVDLSTLTPQQQEELRAQLVAREWSVDFKVVDKPMYQAVLLKYNERSYDLLFQFDHSIFDAASGQTFRGDILRRYEELSAGTSRGMPIAKSYRHLQDQINKGPIGLTADDIIEKFELHPWARHAEAMQAAAARFEDNRIQDVRYSFDLRRLQSADGADVESFSLVVHLFARMVARLLGVDKVALDILFQAREYEHKDYSEVIGMVLGSVPVVISGERGARDDLAALITDRFRLMNEHNVSFLNLVHDLPSLVKYGKVFGVTQRVRGKSFRSSCLLNFVGNVEDEYDAIWDMTLAQLTDDQQKLDYADFYCVSKINKGQLDLLILSKWVTDPREITTILDEEVEYLTRYAAADRVGVSS